MAGGADSNESASSMKGGASLAGDQAAATMPSLVCVECGRPVARLYRQYTSNIRLGRCGYCRSVADKYIECEFVLIAIDLALHRIQAYRHLLFNRKPFSTHSVKGRLWQLGVAMAALDAHLRHTALSSEAAYSERSQNVLLTTENGNNAAGGGGDPFWEAGGLLLAAVVEHACFAAGAVLCARRSVALRHERRRKDPRGRDEINATHDRGGGDEADGRTGPSSSSSSRTKSVEISVVPPPAATTKMYMAVVYPLFFRLLAAFVMIWDRQLAILNTIELLVATMQFVALAAVVGGAAAVSGMGEGGVAACAIVAGWVAKMGARAVLCVCFGTDSRTLRML